MSEWHEIKDPDSVSLSEDGKTVEILFKTNRNGNVYVEVPVEFLVKLLQKSDDDYFDLKAHAEGW